MTRNAIVVQARRTASASERVIAATLAVAVAAILLSACGSSKSSAPTKVNLSIAHVEQSIEQSIFAKRGIHAKVTCPTTVPQEKGRVFTCIATGTTATGRHGRHKAPFSTPFTVTVQNSQGYVTYSS
ncbi:MAG TPA: hypothetical protein VHS55_05185 [Solirubrobacteraceae bacterium]|nr:hypothetical protein [Solirubrobacteraceae bacterium]